MYTDTLIDSNPFSQGLCLGSWERNGCFQSHRLCLSYIGSARFMRHAVLNNWLDIISIHAHVHYLLRRVYPCGSSIITYFPTSLLSMVPCPSFPSCRTTSCRQHHHRTYCIPSQFVDGNPSRCAVDPYTVFCRS